MIYFLIDYAKFMKKDIHILFSFIKFCFKQKVLTTDFLFSRPPSQVLTLDGDAPNHQNPRRHLKVIQTKGQEKQMTRSQLKQ